MKTGHTFVAVLALALSVSGTLAPAQVPSAPQGPGAPGGRGGGPPVLPGPPPSHADLDYAPPDPAGSNGHKLDLYIPGGVSRPGTGRHLDRRVGMDG